MPPLYSKEWKKKFVQVHAGPRQGRTSPCEMACPAGNPIQKFHTLIAAGNSDEALAAMADGDLNGAQELLKEAEALIVKANNAQTEVIQSQVSGESMEYSLLFIHAQDTLMTINTELRMTKKLLPIVKMLMEKKEEK